MATERKKQQDRDRMQRKRAATASRIADLEEYLRFIERWAVYKTGPAEERLSVIAFYPPIRAITRSYTGEPRPPSEADVKLMKEMMRE